MAIAKTLDDPEREVELVYTNIRLLGSGAFGTVRYAKLYPSGDEVAVKRVFDDPRYRNRELQIARLLKHPNIARLHYYYYTENIHGRYLYLIMEFVPDTLLNALKLWRKDESKVPSVECIQRYTRQMFQALKYLHLSVGVCHRDIKPENILVNPTSGVLKLCDFGSAKQLNTCEPNIAYICSRYYRAPELILGATSYTVAVDIWSAGCCFGAMILLREPLFPGSDRYDQLYEITKVLGTTDLLDYIKRYGVKVDRRLAEGLKRHSRKEWKTFTNIKNQQLMTGEAIDLLSLMMTYDPAKRFTAEKVLQHKYLS